MLVSDFHFELPEELIAQHPPTERGASRMLVLDRVSGAVRDDWFRSLPQVLEPGDLLVLNDSRVLPGRLFATRGGLGTQAGSPAPSGVIEVLLVEEVGDPTSQNRDMGHPAKADAGILRSAQDDKSLTWRALVKPAKKVRVGERLEFRGSVGGQNTGILRSAQNDNQNSSEVVLVAEVVGAGEFGERTLRFGAVEDFYGVVGRIGHMPLPPYIKRPGAKALEPIRGREEAEAGKDDDGDSDSAGQNDAAVEAEDQERYQTVYSQAVGSAAAPTAGLHFTPKVLAELKARGVEVVYVTLHVGLGTFQPVRVSELKDIRLHAERYTLPAETAEALNRALAEGRRVVAVGTTTTRVLEHVAREAGEANQGEHRETARVPGVGGAVRREFEAHSGATSIFIGPGHRFRVVSGLLTNFHLPESTLLMLVAAFAGREPVLAAYAHAVLERYRFYSYGDCMLVTS